MARSGMTAALRLGLVFLVVSALTPGCSQKTPPPAPKAAPAFELETLDGARVRLGDHAGKVVLLDFWATWCPPCRAAIPHLSELQETHRSDGLVVIGMNMDQDGAELATFLSRETVNYPMLQVDDATRMAYGGVASIPQTFLVDRKGMIRQKYLGYDRKIARDLDAAVESLLQEKP